MPAPRCWSVSAYGSRCPTRCCAPTPRAIRAALRAEEVAASSSGDFARAKAIVEEHIASSQFAWATLGEECLARNARGLSHLNDGELEAARAALRALFAMRSPSTPGVAPA